jgi:hypothetical protein
VSAGRSLVSGATLQVRHARLRGGVAADRDRLQSQLDGVSPASIGLPAGAILVVPRLVPRRRLSRQGDDGMFAGEVAEALRTALRRARRPGEARSSDDALLFLSEAEAVADLIGQWLAGAAPEDRGWWPHFTGGQPPLAWLRRRILPDARRLPALVAAMARRGLAEPLLGRLEPEDVRVALGAMAASCGLSLPVPAPSATPAPSGGGGDPDPTMPEIAKALALLDAVVPEARRTTLAPLARLLLVLTLLAERRPAMLATRTAKIAFGAAASARPPVSAQHEPPHRLTSPSAIREQRARRPEARAGEGPREPQAPVQPAVEDVVEQRPGPAAASAPAEPAVRRAERPAPTRAVEVEGAPESAEIATAFGGLLFLLNALLALEIYGDFSRPERALPGLSPFGLLRLLGRAWFGSAFVDDPLNALLVRLAGGRRADAARDFEGGSWSVPRAWLAPWPKAGPPLVGGDRLRPMLWHPAGFPLAELNPAGPAAAGRAARRLGMRRPRPAGLPALPVQARARWMACLRLYLEARLAKALGAEDGAEAVAMLCRRPAHVVADDESVSVRFPLEDHPIAIRLAGLDRDSGWIPAARRVFRYVFE